MLNTVLNKVYASIITFSVFFLSDFTGNNVKFSDLHAQLFDNGIVFSGRLSNAFDNDFDEIFYSGLSITIQYEVRVMNFKEQILEKRFNHTISWDAEKQYWIVYQQERDEPFTTNSITELKRGLESFETTLTFNTNNLNEVDVYVTAKLPKLKIPSLDKDFDPMLLWKSKQPVGRLSVNMLEFT